MRKISRITLVLVLILASDYVVAQSPGWTVNPADWSSNGSITAVVYLGENLVTTGTLGAFVGETCRGYGDGILIESRAVFPVMCYANINGEVLNLRYYDPGKDTIYTVSDTIHYKSDMTRGSFIAPLEFHILLNGAPVLDPIGNKTICQFSELSFTATATDPDPADILTYSLVGAPTGANINSLTGAFTWTPDASGSYTFKVKVTDNGTPVLSDEEQITVTVNAIPTAPTAGNNGPICAGGTLNLTASTVTGATYAWTGPNSFTSTLQNPTIASATTAATGLYSVTATVNGCTSAAGTTTATVNAIPTAPTAGNNGPICAGSTLNLTATLVTGATYAWTGPNSFSSTLQNPTITNATTAATGIYSVTATVNGCTSTTGTTTATVNAIPAAPTAGNNGPICAGSTLNLTATTITGATYAWTGPNSFTSTAQNPTITNATTAATGLYSVTATVNGCTSTAGTTTATVNAIPTSPTAGNNGPVCAGGTLNLTATLVTGATYAWTGPNSFTSTLQNPTITNATTAATGLYSVTATVNGCTSTAGTTTATINAIPAAPTAGNNGPICAGGTLNLTASTVTGATYAWTGPNGFTSTLQNPTVASATTAATGLYSVSATVNGCTSTAGTTTATVNAIPAAPTAGNNGPICAGSTLNLTATLVTGATYAWTGPNSFTSTAQNPTITNATTAATGLYSVTATVNGCTSTAGTTTATVNAIPSAPTAGNNGPICAGGTLNLTATTITGATYAWTGPNSFTSTAQNPTITNATTAAAGLYSVTATVNGCTSTAGTTTATVNAIPSAPTAGNNGPICAGSTLNLTASTVTGATYAWTGPDGFTSTAQNPSITNATTAATGLYSVTAMVSGCTSTAGTTTATVNAIPSAPTAGNNGPICAGGTLNLTATTITGATYAWTGPNSFSSTLQNPTITNATTAATGLYSVTATVNGCTSTAGTTTATVNPLPVVDAGLDVSISNGTSTTLNATVTGADTYSWEPSVLLVNSLVEDPTTVNLSTTTTFTLTATSSATTCSNSDNIKVTVTGNALSSAPTATPSTVCAGSIVQLDAMASGGSGSYSYVWTSNPSGFSSTGANPTATPSITTTYNVEVNDGFSTVNSQVTVTVNAIPTAPTAGNGGPICAGSTLNLTATLVTGATYAWTGPNSFSSTLQNPTITNATTAATGIYSVTATVNGCTSTTGTTTATVNAIPTAPTAGNNGPICAGGTLNLTASTVTGATYAWTGPNSFTSTAQNPTITNATTAATGLYSVTATVNGCTSAAGTTTATVNAIPTSPTAGNNGPVCAGGTLNLTATLVTGATYAWTGPNSFTSTLQNPTITNATTAATGLYSVTATVNGCTSTAGTTTATINAIPAAPTAGNNGPVCAGGTLNLTATLVTGATYAWTGPNSFTSTAQNPTITNATTAATGLYSVSATVNGCTSTAGTTTATVNAIPAAPTAGNNGPICAGSTLNLTATLVTGATYAWTGPNSFTSTAQNPTITNATTAATGLYSVTATVNGCTSTAGTTTATVNAIPSAPTAGNNGPICAGGTLNLTATTITGATYAWTGPNSFTSTAQNPTITNATTAAAGLYSVTATVNGCTSTAGTTTATVNAIPSAPTAGNNGPICAGSTLNLTASTVTGATYAWTGPDGFTSTAQNPSITNATTAATGLYSVTAMVSGCTSTAGTTTATVNAIPSAPTAGNNGPICAGGTLNLTATTITGATYAWTGPNSFSSTLQNPTITNATTAATGLYSVTATVNGCTSTAGTTTATVNPLPVVDAGLDVSISNGTSTTLNATVTGADTYSWEPSVLLVNSLVEDPTTVNLSTTTTFTLTATSSATTCSNSDNIKVTVTGNALSSAPTATPSTVCAGSIVQLDAMASGGSGSYSYVWTSNPSGFSSTGVNPTATPSITTTYNVEVNDGFSTVNSQVTVTVNAIPTSPTAGNNGPICAGSTLNLTATLVTGATYAWTGPNSFTSTAQNPTITNATTAATGLYSVTATVNGCTSTAGTTTATVNAIPAAPTAGNNGPICAGGTLNLTASTITGATYAWTGPNSFTSALQNPTITNATTAATGLYSVTATVNGCTSTAGTTTATVNAIPTAPTAGNNGPICAGGTLNLTATLVTGATYAWTGPNSFTSTAQNPTITNATTAATGLYSVTATVNGCTSAAGTTTATVNAIPAAPTAGNNGPICAGSTLNLTATLVTGATYAWTGPDSFTSTAQNPSITNATTAATGLYSVTATVNGCTSTAGTTTATVNPLPVVDAGLDVSISNGTSTTLNATVTGADTYSWIPSVLLINSLVEDPTTVNLSTTTTFTLTATSSATTCSNSDNIKVTVTGNALSSAPTATPSTVCAGSTVQLDAMASGGSGSYSYVWTSNPSGFSSTGVNPTATPSITTTYNVEVNDGFSTVNSQVTVTVNAIPTSPTAGNNGPICAGSTLNLTATLVTGATYAWTGPNSFTSTAQNPTITNVTTAATGLYSVTATVNGCTSIAGTTTATVNDIPAAPTAGNNGPVCAGATLNLTASTVAGATYAWTGPNSFTSTAQNPTITNATTAATGLYSVTATVNGCTSAAGTTTATVNAIPAAPTAGNNGPICAGSTLNLTATLVTGATYAWTGPNSFTSTAQNPTITNATTAATGLYSVSATVNGCTSTAGTTTATVNAIPAAPTAGNNGPICAGGTLNLTATLVTGATYAWTGPNSFTSTAQNPTITNATTAATGLYSVTATVNGCTSAAGTTTATVNAIPAAPTAGNNGPICAGGTLNLTATLVTGATYAWTGPNSFTSTLQNPSITNATTAATGLYSATATVNGCTSTAGTTTATVNAIPAAPTAGNNGPICAGSTLNLTATLVTGATYAWTGPNSFTSTAQNPTITNATTAATGLYSVTATVNGCTSTAGTTTATVNTIPSAPTAGNNGPICAGGTLNLTATLVTGATYAWTGPNSFTSTAQNPTITNATTAATGLYSVTATVNGCTSTAGTTTATVNAIPAAPTAGNNGPICAGGTLNLTASTITGATYAWTGPNSFTSALQNPTITNATTAAIGLYSVTATVNGCTSTAGTTTATVNAIPTAPTAGNNGPICAGGTLNLTATLVTGATYAWTGPNSFTSTAQNPTITNATTAATGLYSVTATVNGCTSAAGTTTATVNAIPAAPTAGNNGPVCAGGTLNLTATLVTGATYAWTGPNSFTSTAQNPTITNATTAATGLYSVSATVNGCTSTAGTTTATVNAIPAAPTAGNNGPICAGSTLNLTATLVTGATYAWTGPNSFTSTAQNPTITNATTAATGLYSVTATVNGCTSTAGTTTATVNAIPAAPTAGNNGPVCEGGTLTLTATLVTGATYAWTGPNSFTSTAQNPTITNATTAATGLYSVTATVNGCTSTAGTTTATVNAIPAAPTAGNNGPICAGSTLNLTATLVTGATYAWTGPDSFTSTAQNPTITNATTAATGLYSVTATVNGCTSAAGTTTATVNAIPSAPTAGNNGPICAGGTLNLTATTITGATYAWTGPNSFSSTLQNPTITNATTAATGLYSVTATVNGCTSTAGTTTATVNPLPVVDAGLDVSISNGTSTTLNATVTGADTYSWIPSVLLINSLVEDPTTVNLSTTTTFTLTATSSATTCSNSDNIKVTVTGNALSSAPTATPSTVCAGSTVQLDAMASGGSGSYSYVWTSNPSGFSSTGVNPTATPSITTTYNVEVNDGFSTVNSQVTVTVNAIPTSPTAGNNGPICAGSTLNLTATLVTGATYAWTGPNSFSSTLQNPTITNATTAATGIYSVTATVNGCTSTTGTTTATVNAIPTAPTAGNNGPICAGGTLNLTASTVTGATYAWTGPNSFTSTAQNPTITNATTAATGLYSVTATVNGCTSAAGTTTATVNAIPAAPTAGNNGPVCAGGTLNLTATLVTGATYAWTGPNSFTSTLQNPTITNATTAATGLYSVTATVNGCTSAAGTTTATVNAIPAAPTAGNNGPICAGSTLNLTATLVTGATYAWTGPNSFTSTAQNPTITNATTAATGLYSVTATVNGCTSAAGTTTATVNAIPAAPTAGNNGPICAGGTLNLTATLVTGATYAWTGPNSFTSTAQNPTITNATTAATGLYSVTATVNGCTSAAGTTTATVNAIPAAPTAGNNGPICAGGTLNLTATLVTGATYAWTGPNSFTSTLQNPSITNATTAATGLYSATATVNGCTSTAGTTTATVNAIPAAPTAGNNGPICAGSTLNLTATLVTGATYAWTGPNSFTSTAQNPTITNATTAATGLYSVTATVNGCTSTAGTTTATVNAIPSAPTAGNNGPVCAGGTLNLTATLVTGATYAWTGPNSFTSTAQNPTITSATTAATGLYSVTATVNGCTSTAGTTTATVNPLPVTLNITGNTTPACSGTGVIYSVTLTPGSSYAWTVPPGATITAGATGPENNQITVTFGTTNGNITVTETTSSSCTGTTKTLTVSLAGCGLSANFTAVPATVCLGTAVTFTNTSTGTSVSTQYDWNFGSGAIPATANTIGPHNVTYSTSGSKTVSLKITEGASNTITVPNAITVTSNVTITAFTPAASTRCQGTGTVTYTTTATNSTGITYSLDAASLAGGNSIVSTTGVVTYSPTWSGTTTITASAAGCNGPATTAHVVTVYPLPVPVITGSSTACQGISGNVYTTTAGMTNYIWSVSAGGTITAGGGTGNNSATVTWNTTGAKTISVSYTNGNGCTSAPPSTYNITVNPVPVITGTTPASRCGTGTVTLAATASAGTINWYSTLTGGTSDGTGLTFITPSITATKTYYVDATSLGCTSSPRIPVVATVTIIPSAAGSITGPATFTPGTNGIAYSVAAIPDATSYIWTYTGTGITINGNGTNSITIDFSASATGGQLKVKGSNSCGDGTESSITLSSTQKSLNITVLLEGIYNGTGGLVKVQDCTDGENSFDKFPGSVSDTLTVQIAMINDPYTIVYSAHGVPVNTDGTVNLSTVPGALNSNYYIIIKHRNHIETWSQIVSFSGQIINYNFTDALTKAWANNMVKIGSIYCIYTGDTNKDQYVDGFDLAITFNLNKQGGFGYKPADINGDGFIDGFDMAKVFNNNKKGVGMNTPAAPMKKKK